MSDLISRQAMLDGIDNLIKIHFDRTVVLYKARKVAEDLPSVQPEHKTGHWIEMSSANHTYKCSECGRLLVNITDGKNKVAKNYPYCHCGADMRGEQDG